MLDRDHQLQRYVQPFAREEAELDGGDSGEIRVEIRSGMASFIDVLSVAGDLHNRYAL